MPRKPHETVTNSQTFNNASKTTTTTTTTFSFKITTKQKPKNKNFNRTTKLSL